MADSPKKWGYATFFVVAKNGIGYGDPDLLPNSTKEVKDALILRWGPLKNLWEEHGEYLIPLDIPVKPNAPQSGQGGLASRTIAEALLKALPAPKLRKHLPN